LGIILKRIILLHVVHRFSSGDTDVVARLVSTAQITSFF